MFDTDVGVNWHLRLRLKIEELQERVDYLNMKNRLLRNKIIEKKHIYEPKKK